MTTTTTITDSQIRNLRTEAATAGDAEQVAICDRALAGDTDAVKECERVVRAAAAMDDSEAARLIARSISHTEVVTAPFSAGLADSLNVECEDSVESGNVTEYWGTDEDGNEWRVHLRSKAD